MRRWAGNPARTSFSGRYTSIPSNLRDLKGDIFALVDYPFADVNTALNGPAHWCDVLILHINTKYCRASTDNAGTVLTVSIGKKVDQPLDGDLSRRVCLSRRGGDAGLFRSPAPRRDRAAFYQRLPHPARSGSLEGGKTILHLTYSYAYGLAGRLAMQAYLATVGRGKVGFTIIGKQPNGQPDYIGGVRGVVERNTMRYFLAIDAYLGALAAPLPEQFEKRLQSWYTSTEGYARQLHDVDRIDYIDMKRREYRRQQTAQQAQLKAQARIDCSWRAEPAGDESRVVRV